MVGITSILNEQANPGSQISLFYNLTNKNIALEQRSESSTRDPPTKGYVSEDTSQVGFVENPSQVAATSLNGISVVFGLTAQAPDPNGKVLKDHDVSILSPVYRPLAATATTNKTITAASDGDTASVIYLTGAKGNRLLITEQTLGSGDPTSWKGHGEVHPESSLAAYYAQEKSGNNRRVVYQNTDDGDLYDYSPGHGDVNITNADARDGSPLAISVAGGKAYLYYVTNRNELERIVKDDIATADSWGENHKLSSNNKKVHQESQITVVAANGKNHIFYAPLDKPASIEHIVDSWL